jgi:hypothetical protein
MVLPPLELFSLRRELPCCRAALSVFCGLFSGLFLIRFNYRFRLGPRMAAGFAEPGIGGLGAPEHDACGTLPADSATVQSEEQVADVAQLVEQLIRNQQVVSSSLTVGSIHRGRD